MLNNFPSAMHSMPNFAVLVGESRHESSAKQQQVATMFVSDILDMFFQLVQRISLHFKSPYLYLFCTTKVFPKFLLPFESQASFQSEEFGSHDYAPQSLSLVACSLSGLGAQIPVDLCRIFNHDNSQVYHFENNSIMA